MLGHQSLINAKEMQETPSHFSAAGNDCVQQRKARAHMGAHQIKVNANQVIAGHHVMNRDLRSTEIRVNGECDLSQAISPLWIAACWMKPSATRSNADSSLRDRRSK